MLGKQSHADNTEEVSAWLPSTPTYPMKGHGAQSTYYHSSPSVQLVMSSLSQSPPNDMMQLSNLGSVIVEESVEDFTNISDLTSIESDSTIIVTGQKPIVNSDPAISTTLSAPLAKQTKKRRSES